MPDFPMLQLFIVGPTAQSRRATEISVNRTVAFPIFLGSQTDNLISSTEAFIDSYNVLQRASSSSAGEAVSKLAARFAAGTDDLAQFVRKDQDITSEAERLGSARRYSHPRSPNTERSIPGGAYHPAEP